MYTKKVLLTLMVLHLKSLLIHVHVHVHVSSTYAVSRSLRTDFNLYLMVFSLIDRLYLTVFFVTKSLLGIVRQKKLRKFAILT